jgi:hypothetical protein
MKLIETEKNKGGGERRQLTPLDATLVLCATNQPRLDWLCEGHSQSVSGAVGAICLHSNV